MKKAIKYLLRFVAGQLVQIVLQMVAMEIICTIPFCSVRRLDSF